VLVRSESSAPACSQGEGKLYQENKLLKRILSPATSMCQVQSRRLIKACCRREEGTQEERSKEGGGKEGGRKGEKKEGKERWKEGTDGREEGIQEERSKGREEGGKKGRRKGKRKGKMEEREGGKGREEE
jgi:hypothetical protein